jgi:amidophosphoribosyltransferase
VPEMAAYIGADSLAFISVDGLYRALGQEKRAATPNHCDACFTGDYPTRLTDQEEATPLDQLALTDERVDA